MEHKSKALYVSSGFPAADCKDGVSALILFIDLCLHCQGKRELYLSNLAWDPDSLVHTAYKVNDITILFICILCIVMFRKRMSLMQQWFENITVFSLLSRCEKKMKYVQKKTLPVQSEIVWIMSVHWEIL